MELIETLRKILYILLYKLIKSVKETILQLFKSENLIILFIFTTIMLAGLYTNIKQKIIVYLLAILFLFLVCYRTIKSKKAFWLHDYKVLKGINWKDKLRDAKEEIKKDLSQEKKDG